ncbi:heme lyase CcmF/NrfE family subunit [Acidiphilium acidophilum]|uniref:Heme lyase CcmF/NrfE family subunit n=1 Tax=Acidiphilium acidophilum TaxID=76588 RepID=A0AAW9DU88_ACIAO|nr:heme lyase CcmF/NrfE family subunit [Acidiphilium acidophilum]MDX5932789.1 heme lyase CcmF/NrfE family subunit [Acidiphilium acidophilum]
MIPALGHFALVLAFVISIAQAVLGLFGPPLRDRRVMAAPPALAISQFLMLAASFGALVWAGVVSDYTVRNVADYSSSLTPLFYRIAGTWGNHDGSMLLWCLILSFCGGIVGAFGRGIPSSLRARVCGVMGLVSTGFLLFTLTVSDPFQRIWPPPLHGAGVNPVLQSPGLVVHPPVLYVGYVGFSIAFAFAVAALIEGRVDAAWGRWVRPWTLFAWTFLTAGICLGSLWSYTVLGWGGFWFWDPVENVALLPWITGTALIHSAIVVEKRDSLKVWTILLAITTFALSLCGTFLVRSGILNSVHSFAVSPAQGNFLLMLISITIIASLILFVIRAPLLVTTGVFAPVSREGALILNNVFLCIIAAVVFTGTLYPPFSDLLFNIQLSVGAPFFDSTVLPLTAPLIISMAAGPLMPWKRADALAILRKLWLGAVAAVIILAVMLFRGHAIAALGLAGAVWVIIGALVDLAEKIRLFRVPLGQSLGRIFRLQRAQAGAILGHLGFGIMVLGIAGMTLRVHTVTVLRPGQSVALGGYSWTLESIHKFAGPDYKSRQATVLVTRDGHKVMTLRPALHYFTAQQTQTVIAAIRTDGVRNIFATFAGMSKSGAAEFRFNIHPLAPELWFGGLIMAIGGTLSLFDRRLRVGAPARRPTALTDGSAIP